MIHGLLEETTFSFTYLEHRTHSYTLWTLGSSSTLFLRGSSHHMGQATISPKTCVRLTPFLHLNVRVLVVNSVFRPQFEEYHA